MKRRDYLYETATTEVTGAGTNPGKLASAGNDIEASSPIFYDNLLQAIMMQSFDYDETAITGAGTNPGNWASAGSDIEASSPIFYKMCNKYI